MTRIILLAVLMISPAHADSTWCNGVVVSNGSCIGSESNVPPVIVRCNYYDNSGNSDPRCVGVSDHHPTDRPRPKSTTPR